MPYTKKQWEDRIVDAGGAVIQAGTPVSAGNMNRIEQGVADAHAALEGANRQAQTIGQGVTVLNAAMNAPVNVEVEGRTLTSLGNSVLDNTKNYVLTAKRTKIKVGAGTPVYQGVAKFTGESGLPQVTRIANFEDKVSGSTLENPHRGFAKTSATLDAPSTFTTERGQANYTNVSKLDGIVANDAILTSGQLSQQLFSFNLIAEIEAHIGTIPRSDVAGKVQWIKDNVTKLTANWHGFGSGPAGNKATLAVYNAGWVSQVMHTNGSVTKLFRDVTNISGVTDASGLVHFLAYAEASDGTTASAINTDYIDLEVELKAGANFHDPSIALYEVDAADYAKILVDWNEEEVRRRYPAAKGTEHVNGLAIIAEGDNLLPPFIEWVLNANARAIGSYELELNSTALNQYSNISIPVLPNTQYTFKIDNPNAQTVKALFYQGSTYLGVGYAGTGTGGTLTTPANCNRILAEVTNANTTGKFIFSNPILTLGSTAKPFVPRNPSMLLAPTKLGAIGVAKDLLFKQDGVWKRRKAVEKDVVLDGSLAWAVSTDFQGYKSFYTTAITHPAGSGVADGILTKYNGLVIPRDTQTQATAMTGPDRRILAAASTVISISDVDTGFGETYSPTVNEIKAYFNGWKKTAYAAANPATPPNLAVSGTAGTLPAGTYYVKYTWVTASGETVASPSTSIAVAAGQQIDVTLPAFPPGVTSANVYISATSGSETKQGNTTTGTFTQSAGLAAGTALPAANTAVDQWKSVVDGTTNPTTNTIAFVSANLAPNYTPYKLSYVLATPVVETVNAEGDIVANGPTQIEVTAGAVVREKATVGTIASTGYKEINGTQSGAGSYLKNKASKILSVFKNGQLDDKWIRTSSLANGNDRVYIAPNEFDAAAEYTVTYLAFDRQLFTINPLDVDTSFAQNVRSAVDDLNAKTGDTATMVSIHATLLYDVLKRLKAGGL